MYKIDKLKNGLTLITLNLPHLDSVTSLVAIGAGSRHETKNISGISHFLEHMFFKGSKKYPTAEMIASLVDGIGAINNAGTEKEWTDYWIKSDARHIEMSMDILSSMIKEPLFDAEEIEKEKGVIIEEIRMYHDMPSVYVEVLFEELLFGDQPLGWDIAGEEEIVKSLKREDFIKYMDSHYDPHNMALVFAGKLPKDIKELSEKYFGDLPKKEMHNFQPAKSPDEKKSKVRVFYKDTDQAHLSLGVEGFSRDDPKRYASELLGVILGEGSSSRLFVQIRERRGLAYHIGADTHSFKDTGIFRISGALKVEKLEEGLRIILEEIKKTVNEKVTEGELQKAKEMVRGRIALRSESTNFLAEHFGTEQVIDKEIESFDDYLKKIDAVTQDDILKIAKELLGEKALSLQLIGPFKSASKFEMLLKE